MNDSLTLEIKDVAELLHISIHTARQLVSTEPERLPPRLNVGGRRVLFLRSAVEKWLEERSGN